MEALIVSAYVLNYDFGVTSMYFYKDMGDQKLYAGPVWDYDGCMGAGVFNNPKVLAVSLAVPPFAIS